MKLLKTQLYKIGQSGKFVGTLLGSLLNIPITLMKNVVKPSAKSILIPLGLAAAASVTVLQHY